MEKFFNYDLLVSVIDGFIIAVSYLSFWFLYSLKVKRNDVADIAWGIGFILIAFGLMLITGNFSKNVILVNILVALWGIRLFLHIGSRNVKKSEDERYKKWRETWKYFKTRSYFQVYILQATLMTLVSLAIIVNAKFNMNSIGYYSFVGLAIWAIGYGFELLGDYQLKIFINNPKNKGKLMDKGLWRYTRHPNYFGEVVLWWGIFIITLPAGFWWISILGPITITFLILKVSGIPMTERHFEGRPGWAEYKSKTSSFIPLPPKS